MLCPTLNQLFQLCYDTNHTFAPADMIRLACNHCSATETCPTMTQAEYDARQLDASDSINQ